MPGPFAPAPPSTIAADLLDFARKVEHVVEHVADHAWDAITKPLPSVDEIRKSIETEKHPTTPDSHFHGNPSIDTNTNVNSNHPSATAAGAPNTATSTASNNQIVIVPLFFGSPNSPTPSAGSTPAAPATGPSTSPGHGGGGVPVGTFNITIEPGKVSMSATGVSHAEMARIIDIVKTTVSDMKDGGTPRGTPKADAPTQSTP